MKNDELMFDVNEVGGVTVISIGPRLDLETGAEMEQKLNDIIDKGATEIVLDMRDVEYISSFGLSLLIKTGQTLSEKGGALTLARLQPFALDLLQISKLESTLPAFDGIKEAAEAAAGRKASRAISSDTPSIS